MNLEQASVVLRSRSPFEVLELALVFWRQLRPDATRRLTVLTLLPVTALLFAAHYGLGWSWLTTMTAALVASWFLELPFLVFAGAVLFDLAIDVRTVLRDSVRRVVAFSLVVLYQIFLTVLLLPTAVGPLFGLATFCFAPEVAVLERSTARGSIQRARRLLRGRSGTGVQTVFFGACLKVAGVLCCEALGQTLWSFVLDIQVEGDSLYQSGGSPFALLGLMLSVPLTSYYRFLSYINERTSLDGWDVQVAFLGIARDTSPLPRAEAT